MSRIGKSPIDIPSDVTVRVQDSVVTVEGKGGTLSQMLTDDIRVLINDNVVTLERPSDSKTHRAVHGLYRSLIFNMVMGVSEGWTKKLELVGVGFRATLKGEVLNLQLGFSHDINFKIPKEVKITVEPR